ncbi:MAG: hypothetical protein ACHP78_09370 [Terriglobales bacterium]
MNLRIVTALALWALSITGMGMGQTSVTPASDQQASLLASQAILALNHGVQVSDVTLTGTVTYTAGSDIETGTATLKALAAPYSRIDLSLNSTTRSEVRDLSSSMGAWIDGAGVAHQFALHNCMSDAAWFFPAFTSLSAGPNTVLSYVGRESRDGSSVWHLRSYTYAQAPYDSATMQRLSAMDFYLDSDSLLPVAITFSAHPDDQPNIYIPVEVDFSDYQVMSGITVPLRIQRRLQGTNTLEFVISAVAVNTGLTVSTFAVN